MRANERVRHRYVVGACESLFRLPSSAPKGVITLPDTNVLEHDPAPLASYTHPDPLSSLLLISPYALRLLPTRIIYTSRRET